MDDVYAGLEPVELWRHFGALNAIPRPSGQEAAAREYVEEVARRHGAAYARDARGNLVVSVPPSPGREGAPAVAVQGHLDMVCEKRPDVEQEFSRDPIRPRIEGDAVYASGTTLGADNGIGCAAALALLTEPSIQHGPLELLFTVEEETGLHGAMALDPALVRARMLLNLDSEDPRELTVGCAGGAGAVLTLPIRRTPGPEGAISARVVVSGLKGGHSGVQIHERLANAIKLLTGALLAALAEGIPLELRSVQGGRAHNAIPRDAEAEVALPAGERQRLEAVIARVLDRLRAEWGADEPNVLLSVTDSDASGPVLAPESRDALLRLLDALPHGVLEWSRAFPGKVETSSNLAQVSTGADTVEIGTSTRSFVNTETARVQDEIRASGEAAGARVALRDGYPGWEPDPDSELLRVAERVYEETFGSRPEVQVIHAGLECGVIVSKLPGMEAISFGPRITGAHTPEEHVTIPTVAQTWRLLTALVDALSRQEA
ncbi:MAG TPA: beta-Ala-His dipeptidase [Armatimonadota bacterium]|nr:beta-Ala-His dipeptidase [Armatimonadota bacterium]